MKTIIDKITNKDRLVKLYGCSECGGCGSVLGFPPAPCPKCNGKGYTINQDSQVLDIVKELLKARDCLKGLYYVNKPKGYGEKTALSQALIKLIELMKYNDSILDERQNSEYDLEMSSIDRDISRIILFVSNDCLRTAFGELLSFCNHHKIDIWQSVVEILEGEK